MTHHAVSYKTADDIVMWPPESRTRSTIMPPVSIYGTAYDPFPNGDDGKEHPRAVRLLPLRIDWRMTMVLGCGNADVRSLKRHLRKTQLVGKDHRPRPRQEIDTRGIGSTKNEYRIRQLTRRMVMIHKSSAYHGIDLMQRSTTCSKNCTGTRPFETLTLGLRWGFKFSSVPSHFCLSTLCC